MSSTILLMELFRMKRSKDERVYVFYRRVVDALSAFPHTMPQALQIAVFCQDLGELGVMVAAQQPTTFLGALAQALYLDYDDYEHYEDY